METHEGCVHSLLALYFDTSYKGWKLTFGADFHRALADFDTSYKGWKRRGYVDSKQQLHISILPIRDGNFSKQELIY